MYKLSEVSLEWSLKHLERYPDSDFFPRLFEFASIKHNWENIKGVLLNQDIHSYIPKPPVSLLAPKPKGGFRVVHQLDPIDSLIYTALVYDASELIERFRIPKEKKIACSYRISTDLDGSFFSKNQSNYEDFITRSKQLAQQYSSGVVLSCDIADFYNQIYLHRVNNIFDECGANVGCGKAVESLLSKLNTKISRGIPVGPQASIIIAEAIMADIDSKIVRETHDYTRYVDDINIFFNSSVEAYLFLHELTNYLYSNHRLVLSSEKTKIIFCQVFKDKFLDDEERHEKKAIHEKIEEMSNEYPLFGEPIEFEELPNNTKFTIRSKAYVEYLKKSLKYQKLDLGLIRHILSKGRLYKIRSLIPVVLENFYRLSPAINYVFPYLLEVLNDTVVSNYEAELKSLLNNNYLKMDYINMWVFTLFQHSSFNTIINNFPYPKIARYREAALIAKSRKDLIWVKDMKTRLDLVGAWDKRAIIYSSSVLSQDERKHWLMLEENRGSFLDTAVCKKVLSN